MSGRLPNAIDRHVASRLRLRRLEAGLSQTTLADALGMSFQPLITGEQPLCKRLRKWQTSALGRSAKLLCRINNIFPALQSCEKLPEGWPCLSTDSASMFGAVKFSWHCWLVSSIA
jgi:DNA-binding XRE family transcriptional regulator